MKININIEATPKEIRETFGLPDLVELQNTFLHQFSKGVADGKMEMNPEMFSEFMGPSFQIGKKFMNAFMENADQAMRQAATNLDPTNFPKKPT